MQESFHVVLCFSFTWAKIYIISGKINQKRINEDIVTGIQ